MECEFCKSKLKTVSSLNYHKKNNKKCLEIQNQILEEVDSALVKCEYCNKNFSSSKKNRHLEICKEKQKKTIDENKRLKIENQELKDYIIKLELKEYIIKLETENNIYKKDRETINDIAKQPKTNNTTNTIINNLSVYEDKLITDRFIMALDNIKPADFYDGQQAIGRILAPCLQNDDGTKMITCSDYSRGIFVKKDKHGNLNKDIKCRNLAELIEPIASTKADELIKKDHLKRNKSHSLKILEDQIRKRDYDIQNIEETMLGLQKNSDILIYYKKLIISKQKDNKKDKEELKNLRDSGLEEILETDKEEIYNTYDPKLLEAADDIKEMKKDSTKFSKTLSEFV